MGDEERLEAILNLLYLHSLVQIASMYGHIDKYETALHNIELAQDILKVAKGELKLEDVMQEEIR